MRLDETPRILTYVGRDQDTWELLLRCFDAKDTRVERFSGDSGQLKAILPSWRCQRVVMIDHFEEPESVEILEQLARCDAGIPVIVLLEGGHPERLTAAGLARLHGAERLAIKPIVEPARLMSVVDDAFRRLDHWRAYLTRPFTLNDEREVLRGSAGAVVAQLLPDDSKGAVISMAGL